MIELPFRFPWRVLWRCALAGGIGLIWTVPIEEFLFVFPPSIALVPNVLLVTLVFWVLVWFDLRVCWTLVPSLLFNMPTLENLTYRSNIVYWPLFDALARVTGIDFRLLAVGCAACFLWAAGYGLTAALLLWRKVPVAWIVRGTLWAVLSTAILFLAGFLLPLGLKHYQMDAIFWLVVLVWPQAFWIGLPWLILDARGDWPGIRACRKTDNTDEDMLAIEGKHGTPHEAGER